MKKIMIIDDDTNLCYSLSRSLSKKYNVITVQQARDAYNHLIDNPDYQLIILDLRLGKENGLHVLERIKKDFPNIPVVMLTAHSQSDIIMKSVQLGAEDFLVKPVDLAELTECIEKYALSASSKCAKGSLAVPPFSNQLSSAYIGSSRASRDVLKLIAAVAPTNTPVLITGDSGTGKEKVAELLVTYSNRSSEPFIVVNCAAIPAELLESELFGFVKGAFSGAVHNKTGLFEKADKGTLFLDEIAELPIELQAKLLRVLQNGMFQKLGSTEYIHIDARIIAATNKNIQHQIEQEQFREDFYYRLNGFNIHLPPLKERKKDIYPLSMFFIQLFADELCKQICCVDEDVFKLLESYDWPGNIRELQNTIKKALILASQNRLTVNDFQFGKSILQKNIPTSINILDYCIQNFNGNIHKSVDWLEKQLIQAALTQHNHHLTNTADNLGITRVTLNTKIEKYNLE